MLIDANGDQLTQRTHPQLSQIKINWDRSQIIASYHGISELKIPLALTQGIEIAVRIWGDEVTAWSYSPIADEWFSKASGTTCRLVYMPENATRAINPEVAKKNESVSFADGYPYLILGENSLSDLNSRLDSAIPMNRFRPNIIFSGGAPYDEDHWKEFKLGDLSFYGGHPCVRCVFPAIDQETGEKGPEPLKTLSTYRKNPQGVIFGSNAIAKATGVVKIGDSVQVLR